MTIIALQAYNITKRYYPHHYQRFLITYYYYQRFLWQRLKITCCQSLMHIVCFPKDPDQG